jgi:hypothetical protein
LLNATNTWFLFLLKIVYTKTISYEFVLRIWTEEDDAIMGNDIPSTKDVAKTYR